MPGVAQVNAEEAQRQAHLARLGELAAQAAVLRDSKPDVSLLLGVEVFNQSDNNQTRSVLLDNAQANPQLFQFLRRHKNEVKSVAFSPNGKILASGDNDGTIIFWDVVPQNMIGQPLHGHQHFIYHVTFSPDGIRIFRPFSYPGM